MMDQISQQLKRSPLLRHLLFLGVTFLAIWCVGYRFGAFDQAFHITFLKKMVYPNLYPGDPFLDLRFYHYSYFWYFFEPFLRMGILEPAMFVTHILATYLTFWMLWELSMTLFNNPLAALITTIAFIFPHIGTPGFPLIEDSLLNRTFVLPFLLLAMLLYLRKRYLPAFLVLGVMLNLHALSVCFVMAMLMCDSFLRWRKVGWTTILFGLLVFGVGASPALFWKANHTGFDLSLRPELLDLAGRGALSSIYYLISHQPILIFTTLCGVGSLALLMIGLRQHPSDKDEVIVHFTFAIGLVVILQVVSTYWLPVTFLLQLQLLRIAFYLLIFGYLYFANFLATQWQNKRLGGFAAWFQVGTFLIVPAPFIAWLVWISRGWLERRSWRQSMVAGLVGSGMLAIVIVGWATDLWQPGFYIYGANTTWVAVQQWARENTPVDSLFITPPQLHSQYVPDWRVLSERSTLVTLDELEDIPFDPAALPVWKERFELLAPGAIGKFDYNYYDNEQITAAAFYSLTMSDIIQIARQYHVSYLVYERPHACEQGILYQNEDFVVCDLRSVTQ